MTKTDKPATGGPTLTEAGHDADINMARLTKGDVTATAFPVSGAAERTAAPALTPDYRVRFHAAALASAIADARTAGYDVAVPFDVAALGRIIVGETGRVAELKAAGVAEAATGTTPAA